MHATPHKAMKLLMFAFLCALGRYASGADQPKAAVPIIVEVSDVVRDWDLVRVHEVQTKAWVTIFFRTWPTTEMESSMARAIRTKTVIRIIEATNVLAEGTVLGQAYGPKPDGGNRFGLMLRFDSLRDAQAAAARIRHDPDTEMRRRSNDRNRWQL